MSIFLFYFFFYKTNSFKQKIGTSSVIYPVADYVTILADENIFVVEVNIETTPSNSIAKYFIIFS